MRYVLDPLRGVYTHVIYRGCGTEGCEYERSDHTSFAWKFCPTCGNPLRDVRVELSSPNIGTAA